MTTLIELLFCFSYSGIWHSGRLPLQSMEANRKQVSSLRKLACFLLAALFG